MVDLDVFDRRLSRLEQLLRRLRQIATTDREQLLRDEALQAQAERWLHLATQCVLDLTHHLIADRGWRTPDTHKDAFAVLCEQGVLSDDEARQMERWAGLRNVLVHIYLDVDHAVIHDILTGDLDQLESFASAMQRAVSDEG